MKSFPSVNYITHLDRFLELFYRAGGWGSTSEMSAPIVHNMLFALGKSLK